MKESNPTPSPSPDRPRDASAISPDELMSDFRGHSLVKIVIFTLVAHVILLGVFSPGYIKTQVFGESDEPTEEVAELSDEEKLEKAQKDGKAALREVADKYGLTIKELKAQLDAEQPAPAPVGSGQATDPADTDDPGPGSAIERELEVEADGPDVPDLSVEDEGDLFAPESP